MRSNLSFLQNHAAPKKRWFIAAIWVICLLYVLFQGGKTSIMLFSMMNILVVYLFISGIYGVRRARGTRTFSANEEQMKMLHAGEQIHVKLSVHIPGFLPLPYVIIRETLKRHNGDAWVFEDSLIPSFRGNGLLDYHTPSLERGRYHFTEAECVTEDIFGLTEHRGKINVQGEFTVLPRSVFIPYWQLHAKNSQLSGPESVVTRSRRETTQINGVRDYVYGDRISRIHWSATAKTGTWKSKQFEHESTPRTILVLDASSAHYVSPSQFELAVSTTASLIDYAIRERMNIGLCALGNKRTFFPPTEHLADQKRMLHFLVDIDADGYGKLADRLEESANVFPSSSYIVLISPLANEQIMSVMRWAGKRQLSPSHIHIQSSIASPNSVKWQTYLLSHGIRSYKVASLEELPSAMAMGGVHYG
ncbi:DUF58 domain-containing protein [Paenibacillus sediminis]|uniref:Uncharacterized protein (DUF58 family) n=1 Tax=Paenibacillus sediminis TaxID=664909 RepID=A0ABS4GYJ0_9BACL|nr:DUF58 domain-containing protein [Paenibacillus sediminis]MBP1935344.1 uncharacterized protein (DUF58 family) [Paenibacillus sediminis]